LKRSLSNIRLELENEIGADEIRQQLHNENIMKELSDTKSELEDIIQNADDSISDAKNSLKSIPSQLATPSADEKIEDTLEPVGVAESGIENPTELDAVETPIDDQSNDAAPKLSGSST
jgi:sec-independent protein translocase protein TatB